MPKATLFIAEFVLQLKANYLQQPFPQGEIREAFSTGNIGQLSRLFDKMPVSANAMAEAYCCMMEAADTHQIETHMRDVVISIAGFLFNEDITDCNENTILNIGKENYEALLTATSTLGAPKQLLMDKLLQAIIVSYAQAVTHHFGEMSKTDEETPSDKQMELIRSFNTKMTLPMELYLAKITRENLLASFQEVSEFNDVESIQTTLIRLSTLIRELREQLDVLKTIVTNPEMVDNMSTAQKAMRIQLDKLAEWHEKLLDNPSPTHVKRALELLSDFPITLQTIIQNEQWVPNPQEPFARGWIELCIDTAAWIFTLGNIRYKTEETRLAETLQSTREKMQSMKAALEEIKTSHLSDQTINFQV